LAHNSYPGDARESEKRQTFFVGSQQIRNMDKTTIYHPKKHEREQMVLLRTTVNGK
jgi:hypothetical protein